MKAFLKNYRQSPRKVRLVAGLIKGKRVADALIQLDALPKRASLPVKNLLVSAVSNAKQAGVKEDNLFVDNITVNKGVVLRRIMPRARGSAFRINKRTSHIQINLTENTEVKPIKAESVDSKKTESKKKTEKVVKKEVISKTEVKEKDNNKDKKEVSK